SQSRRSRSRFARADACATPCARPARMSRMRRTCVPDRAGGRVKYSAGPLVEGCDPLRVICIVRVPDNGACADVRLPAAIAPKLAASAKMNLRVNTRYRIGAAAVRRYCVFDFLGPGGNQSVVCGKIECLGVGPPAFID